MLETLLSLGCIVKKSLCYQIWFKQVKLNSWPCRTSNYGMIGENHLVGLEYNNISQIWKIVMCSPFSGTSLQIWVSQ